MRGRTGDGLYEPVAGGRLALGPRTLYLDDTQSDPGVDGAGDHVDLGRSAHLPEYEGLMTRFERAVTANSRHSVASIVDAQKEQRYAVALLEFLQVQLALEAEVAIPTLRLPQVDLPQIGALVGMVAFEAHPGRAVNEARAVAVSPTDHVPH